MHRTVKSWRGLMLLSLLWACTKASVEDGSTDTEDADGGPTADDSGGDDSPADEGGSDTASGDDSGDPDTPEEHYSGDPACHDAFETMEGIQPHEYDIVEWRSEDGTTWVEHRMFQTCADVPSIASNDEGTLFMAFQNFQDRDDDSLFDKIALRRSDDGGDTWGEVTGANLIDFPSEAGRPFDPTIVWDAAGSVWRLYFSMNSAGGTELDENVCTHSAQSENGVDFTYESGTRYCAVEGHVIDPAVVWMDGTWYYSAPRGAPQEGAHFATSADGRVFERTDPIPSDENHAWTGNMVVVDESLRFYAREVLLPDGNLIWWSSFTEGTGWSDYVQTNIPAGKDPGIIRLADGTFMILVPTLSE